MKNGLVGYFYGDDFQLDLKFISASNSNELKFNASSLEESLLDEITKSVKWIGYLNLEDEELGNHKFEIDSANSTIQLNGKVIDGKVVLVEAGKKHTLVIEQLLFQRTKVRDIPAIRLFLDGNPISINHLIVPDEVNFSQDISKLLDSDNDGIPDFMEINGYTIINSVLVPWSEKYKAKGYKKYLSNPYRARTTGDPYTDLQKALGQIDESIDFIARDPMIAACPVVSVHMEKLIIAKNQTESSNRGTSFSKNTSSSFATGETKGVSVTAQAGYNIVPNFSVSVTGSYSKATQNTTATSDTSGGTFASGLSLNTGQAAFISLNLRYYNSGTAPIYRASPNLTLAINGDSVISAQAQDNQIAEYINPYEYYPKNGLYPICFNTSDQFNSHLIQISSNQLSDIDKGKPINLSVSQFKGLFGKINLNGDLITAGNSWGPYISQIDSKTASFIIEAPDGIKEYKVAARNFNDPEDATPVLTVGELMDKIPNIAFVENFFSYPAVIKLGSEKNGEVDLSFTIDIHNGDIVLSNVHSYKEKSEGDYMIVFFNEKDEIKGQLRLPFNGSVESVKSFINEKISNLGITFEDYFTIKSVENDSISINDKPVTTDPKYIFRKHGIKANRVFYKDKELSYFTRLSILMDENTNKEINAQLDAMEQKNMLDCSIKTKMNMHFKIEQTPMNIIKDGEYTIQSTNYIGAGKSDKFFVIPQKDGNVKLHTSSIVIDNDTKAWSFNYSQEHQAYTISTKEKNLFLTLDEKKLKLISVKAYNGSEEQYWVLETRKDNSFCLKNKKAVDRCLSSSNFDHLDMEIPLYCDWEMVGAQQTWLIESTVN